MKVLAGAYQAGQQLLIVRSECILLIALLPAQRPPVPTAVAVHEGGCVTQAPFIAHLDHSHRLACRGQVYDTSTGTNQARCGEAFMYICERT